VKLGHGWHPQFGQESLHLLLEGQGRICSRLPEYDSLQKVIHLSQLIYKTLTERKSFMNKTTGYLKQQGSHQWWLCRPQLQSKSELGFPMLLETRPCFQVPPETNRNYHINYSVQPKVRLLTLILHVY
jgi:hypothetical protein